MPPVGHGIESEPGMCPVCNIGLTGVRGYYTRPRCHRCGYEPPASKAEKVAYVKRAGQTRDHGCHWPGCTEQVPPAKWGCTRHWYMLPQRLRAAIWDAFRPGQEVAMTPSREYVRVAREVQQWIKEHHGVA